MRMERGTSSGQTIIGWDGGLAGVRDHIQRVLGLSVNVLILGESGTGKEVVARATHYDDPLRRHRPFIALNCAAVPEHLLEADLFGHCKGAFTGADVAREGVFKQADGGTLFLDEIGDLPLSQQPKLLRVLQEKAVRCVGGGREEPVDVRIVAATNRDLGQGMSDGSFRVDLYYRLADFVVKVPPLRQRRGDILPLARHFLSSYCIEFGKPTACRLSDEAATWLRAREWSTNNVRELSAAVKQAVLFCDGPTVGMEHFAAHGSLAAPPSIAGSRSTQAAGGHDPVRGQSVSRGENARREALHSLRPAEKVRHSGMSPKPRAGPHDPPTRLGFRAAGRGEDPEIPTGVGC